MRTLAVSLLLIPLAGCAVNSGPLAPEVEPTHSEAEPTPAPDPIGADLLEPRPSVGQLDLQHPRQTMDRMAAIAAGLSAYRSDTGSYPVAASSRQLVQILSPRYVESLEPVDAWERPFRYELRQQGQSYVLASAGADGEVDATTWDTPATLSDPAGDLVVRDGQFIRSWPRE